MINGYIYKGKLLYIIRTSDRKIFIYELWSKGIIGKFRRNKIIYLIENKFY